MSDFLRVGGESRTIAQRAGAMSAALSSEGHKYRWAIEDLIIADSAKGSSSVTLEKGKLYASAQTFGAHENYHRVTALDVHIQKSSGRLLSFETRAHSRNNTAVLRACVIPSGIVARTQSSTDRGHVVVGGIIKFMRLNPGVAVLLGGPAARP